MFIVTAPKDDWKQNKQVTTYSQVTTMAPPHQPPATYASGRVSLADWMAPQRRVGVYFLVAPSVVIPVGRKRDSEEAFF